MEWVAAALVSALRSWLLLFNRYPLPVCWRVGE